MKCIISISGHCRHQSFWFVTAIATATPIVNSSMSQPTIHTSCSDTSSVRQNYPRTVAQYSLNRAHVTLEPTPESSPDSCIPSSYEPLQNQVRFQICVHYLLRLENCVLLSYFFSCHMVVRVDSRTVETLNMPPVIMAITLNRWAAPLGRTTQANGCKDIPWKASAYRLLRRRVLLQHQRNRSMVVSIIYWLYNSIHKICAHTYRSYNKINHFKIIFFFYNFNFKFLKIVGVRKF